MVATLDLPAPCGGDQDKRELFWGRPFRIKCTCLQWSPSHPARRSPPAWDNTACPAIPAFSATLQALDLPNHRRLSNGSHKQMIQESARSKICLSAYPAPKVFQMCDERDLPN